MRVLSRSQPAQRASRFTATPPSRELGPPATAVLALAAGAALAPCVTCLVWGGRISNTSLGFMPPNHFFEGLPCCASNHTPALLKARGVSFAFSRLSRSLAA